MTGNIILADLDDGITQVTLDRAPVNALSSPFLDEFEASLVELAGDPAVRGIVITSPYKVFSAGLDLKEARTFSLDQQKAIVDSLNSSFAALFRFPKPAVVAATGVAIAGGLFFILAADHCVTHANAQFGLAEVRVGATFPVGPLEIARATLPPSALNRLMLSGHPVSATRAREWGFVDDIVEPDDILDGAFKAARELAASPPKTYAAVKAQIRKPALDIIDAAIRDRTDPAQQGWFNDETKAAMQAMIG
jgi:enoyl-CoA hydratase/carnithine racemase